MDKALQARGENLGVVPLRSRDRRRYLTWQWAQALMMFLLQLPCGAPGLKLLWVAITTSPELG